MLLDWQEAEEKNVAWDESVVTDLTLIDDHAPTIAEREVSDKPTPLSHSGRDLSRSWGVVLNGL
eukprot:CCRYP_012399-RA/>CCRYP_012399-RA protein AED:0.71 eAED:0.40 QI:0/0/0/0.5/0/0/2/0/63